MKFTKPYDRRTRGDFIEIYKMVNEQEQIECVNFQKLRSNLEIIRPAMGVRVNTIRIRRETFKSELRNNFAHSVTITVTMSYSVTMFYSDTVRHNFFLNRIALIMNELPEIVVSSSSLDSFK